MMLELAVLHVLNKWQVELWHIVLVHVEQDISDHDYAFFDLLPDSVELSQELLVMCVLYVLSDGPQKMYRGVLHAVIEHLSMLV